MDTRQSVWDCATGSGQSAVRLAEYFNSVIATDASANQIQSAQPHERVEYRVAPAEQSRLGDHSQDLITVAQALHWFDLEAFYREVNRVIKPDGVLAVWTYNLFRITPAIDEIVNRLYYETIADYWPAERVHVERGYQDLPFPFDENIVPAFSMTASWGLDHLLGYINTWSGVDRYNKANHADAVADISAELQRAWPDDSPTLEVNWPLALRVGRVCS